MTLIHRLLDGKILKSKPLPTRYALQVTPLPRVLSPAATTDDVVHDRVFEVATGPHMAMDYLVRAEQVTTQTHPAALTVSSLTPEKCQTFEGGYVRQLSIGKGAVRVQSQGRSRDIELDFTQSNPSITRFKHFADGTLGRATELAIDTRIAGKDPAAAMPIFSAQDHAHATYVRNPACWAADLHHQLTCASPWNSRGAGAMAGTLIAPSFLLHAAHFPLQIGDTVRFVTADNQVITRTITAAQNHPAYAPPVHYPDIRVAKLDAPCPPSIAIAKLLPSGYVSKFSYPQGAQFSALLAIDQQERALVRASGNTVGSWFIGGFTAEPNNQMVAHPVRAAFGGTVGMGDSGNPLFLIIGSQLVLVTTFTYTFGGTALAGFTADIQSLMNSMGSGGESLQLADLTSFPDFS